MKFIELGLGLGKWIIIKTNSEYFIDNLSPIIDK